MGGLFEYGSVTCCGQQCYQWLNGTLLAQTFGQDVYGQAGVCWLRVVQGGEQSVHEGKVGIVSRLATVWAALRARRSLLPAMGTVANHALAHVTQVAGVVHGDQGEVAPFPLEHVDGAGVLA